MIKYFPDIILSIILPLFNSFLETGQIIEDLCKGLISPIYKEKEKRNPNNYRGICISNALLKSKIFMSYFE